MSQYNHINVKMGEDMFESTHDTIIVTTNCVGVMGKGIALQASVLYPHILPIYNKHCALHEHTPSRPLFISRSRPHAPNILCVATKYDWRKPSLTSYIEQGLRAIVRSYKSWGIKSLAMPPLGCGNGGLDYMNDVRPLFIKHLKKIKIPITIYLPD